MPAEVWSVGLEPSSAAVTDDDAAASMLLDVTIARLLDAALAVSCGVSGWCGEAWDENAISSVVRLVSNAAPGREELLVWRIKSFAVSPAVTQLDVTYVVPARSNTVSEAAVWATPIFGVGAPVCNKLEV